MSRKDVPLTATRPFTVDDTYDATHATGQSRFASYLASRAAWFADYIDPTVPTAQVARFAELAFRIGLPPVMEPGYIRTHHRIQSVTTEHDWDDRLAVVVTLAAPLPAPAAAATASRGWRDWDRDYLTGTWSAPGHYDRPAAYTLITVHVPIVPDALPTPDYDRTGTPRLPAAKNAVERVCRQLNRALGDLVTALDNPPR